MKKNNEYKGTIKLVHPITINGKQVSQLTYNTDEIDGNLFMEAETQSKIASNYKGGMAPIELNNGLHLYLGYAAIIAVNRDVDWNDLNRLKGRDLITIMQVGRSFTVVSEDESAENSSGEPTETTQESTTPASPTSEKEG